MSLVNLLNSNITIQQSFRAWEDWNTLTFQKRVDLISKWKSYLLQQQDVPEQWTNFIEFHHQYASMLIGEAERMPGPTGESNILSTSGRGPFVIMAEDNTPLEAFISILTCTLIAGNSVIVVESGRFNVFMDAIYRTLAEFNIDPSLIQTILKSEIEAVISNSVIAGMAYIGTDNEAHRFNRMMAEREGQIAQLIIETNMTTLPIIHDPYLILRFITEKTETINLTAVGGNANLLALGAGD